jgi:GDP-L-fucose synthase
MADLIAEATAYRGNVVWDTTKPGGQPRRQLDISRARDRFGFEPKTALDEGLKRTVEWYEQTRLQSAG